MYISYSEFINSSYGRDYEPSGSIFATSGEVEEFLSYVSSLIDMVCGRSFGIAEYQQEFDGNNYDVVFLNVIPVTGVVSIVYDSLGASTGVIDASDYRLYKNTGKIKYPDGFSEDLTYTITYHAGYSVIPEQIKLATLTWANVIAQSIANESVAIVDGGSMTQFRFNKFWEQYTDPRNRKIEGGVPPTVWTILSKYRYLKGL